MYWNMCCAVDWMLQNMININMRCIEIYLKGAVYDNGRRLTLTWDVLKCQPTRKDLSTL